jgi:hypothetical protein
MDPENAIPANPEVLEPEWLAIVRSKVRDLRYGVVQLIVHDGRVTQVERTERTRIESPRADVQPR